jgi:uncharacterized protein YecT (DUF1311 family)
MKLISFGYLLFSLALIPAWAQALSKYDDMYDKCVIENAPVNNSVVEACSNMVSDEAKKEITKHYKSIYARLASERPEDAKKFEASQKAWIQYRNIHCDLAGAYVGSPLYAFCPMKLNSSRALELRELDGE